MIGVAVVGARGKLKLASAVSAVPVATGGTVAADVQAGAPGKPDVVRLDAGLSAAWDVIVPGLDAAGLLCAADLPALVLALQHYVVATRAYAAMDSIVVDDAAHAGVKKHPAETVLRAESEMFLKYASQLGMTFVSRARTPSAKGVGEDEPNPFASAV